MCYRVAVRFLCTNGSAHNRNSRVLTERGDLKPRRWFDQICHTAARNHVSQLVMPPAAQGSRAFLMCNKPQAPFKYYYLRNGPCRNCAVKAEMESYHDPAHWYDPIRHHRIRARLRQESRLQTSLFTKLELGPNDNWREFRDRLVRFQKQNHLRAPDWLEVSTDPNNKDW
jgi:hypothetical protein